MKMEGAQQIRIRRQEGRFMNIREHAQELEYKVLSKSASHSADSLGRDRAEPEDEIRTVYQRDRDRIIHSKSFRRLKQKTQVTSMH